MPLPAKGNRIPYILDGGVT